VVPVYIERHEEAAELRKLPGLAEMSLVRKKDKKTKVVLTRGALIIGR